MSKFFRKRQYCCILAIFPSYSYIDIKIEKCNFGLDQITNFQNPQQKYQIILSYEKVAQPLSAKVWSWQAPIRNTSKTILICFIEDYFLFNVSCCYEIYVLLKTKVLIKDIGTIGYKIFNILSCCLNIFNRTIYVA